MPVDPQLSIQAANAQPNIGPVINDAVQNSDQSAMSAQQTLKAHYENLGERDRRRLQSTVVGAAQLKTYLDKDDLEGAHDFLVKRQGSLHARMGAGEDIDDQETAYALEKLRTGDIEGLKNDVMALSAAGQAFGMTGGENLPSSVREYQYYNSLPQEQKDQYLTMKRSNANINLGDKVITPSQSNPSGVPLAERTVGLQPADQPENARAKADAEARGRAAGSNAGENEQAALKMENLKVTLQKLKTSGQAAPSGVAANLGATLANKTGAGGAAAVAQGDFTVKRAASENAIRESFRVAGSGANSDRDAAPFIEMLPVAGDSEAVKTAKSDAAFAAVQDRINAMTNKTSGAPTRPTVVKISNGKETYSIDASDLAAAEKDGFKQIQ